MAKGIAIAAGVSFIAGGIVGYVIGRLSTKKKYVNLANEEVDSVKKALTEYYENKPVEERKKPEGAQKEEKKTGSLISKSSYEGYPNRQESQYTNYTNRYASTNNNKPSKNDIKKKVYVISPEEFGEEDGYETHTLYWYKDEVLADDDWNVEHDILGTLGEGWKEHLKESDAVYVRNDIFKIDYEVLLSDRYYIDDAPSNIAQEELDD